MNNFEDFTEETYFNILKKVKKTYNIKDYDEVLDLEDFFILRHDVDFSPNRAYALAKIANILDIKATFFIQLSSKYYNVFEEKTTVLLKEIISLNHNIGLHFDHTLFKIDTQDELNDKLKFEKNIIENVLGCKIKAFSYHRPDEKILSFDEFKYAGMINSYSKFFKKNVNYLSDSNGYWRYEHINSFLDKKHKKVQLLIHPVWWQKLPLSPRMRVERSIDGRANIIKKEYDESLKKLGRLNVK